MVAMTAVRGPFFEPSKELPGGALSTKAKALSEEKAFDLVMESMNGTKLAELMCAPTDTVYEIKQRLARLNDDCSEQKFVVGSTVLNDAERMGTALDALGGRRVVTCVRLRPSGLASLLRERGRQAAIADPAVAINEAVLDVADGVMRREYELSEKHRPRAAEVTKALSRSDRARLIAWIVETFSVLEFWPGVLYGAVLNLDRYCAARGAPMDTEGLGLALLASICTEMKLASADGSPYGDWRRLVTHMCQNCFELSAILKTEHKVLTILNYRVGIPTSATFFSGLSFRMSTDPERDALVWMNAGFVLLHLSLLDVHLNFRYSHAIIAAAALSAALGVCDAPAEKREILLEDLEAYVSDQHAALRACEIELLSLWRDCASGESDLADYFGPFRQMFDSLSLRLATPLSPMRRLRELTATVDV